MQLRLAAFRKQDWPEYTKMIGQAQQNFMLLSQEETKIGLDHIDLTQQNYNITLQKVL